MTRLWRLVAPVVLIAGSFLSTTPASAVQAGYTCNLVDLLPGGVAGDIGLGNVCVAAPGMPTTGTIGPFTMADTAGFTISCSSGSANLYPRFVNGSHCVQLTP